MKISLRTKTTLGIILFALVLSTMSVYFSYRTYRESMDEHYYEMGRNVAETAASQLDPEVLSSFFVPEISEAEAAELMQTESYQKCRQFLIDVGDTNDVIFLYVVRPLEDGAYYLLDTDQSENTCQLGYFEKYYDGAFADNKDKFLKGEDVAPIISNEDFGWLLSAFHPIKLDGEMVAYICVDISMDEVMMDRTLFLRNVVVLLASVTLVFMLLYLWLVNGMIVRPINQLSKETSRFVAEKNGSTQEGESIEPVKIKTGDEIENLADSIQTMEEDIDRYIVNLTAVTAEKERIGAELNVATRIQASMLPSIFPAYAERTDFELFATMNPAKEVGGDFYDFFLIDEDHLAVVIADVSGKGVPAALFMVIAKTLIKNHMQTGIQPSEVFNKVNMQLCENNDAGMFVTAWAGILEISTGLFTYVNAGHNPPVLRLADGEFEYLKMRPGFVLAGLDTVRYKQAEMQLNPGDFLYMYTDGVVEATNIHNELYGEDRLKAVLDENKNQSAKDILINVKGDVDAFAGEAVQFDDITMVGLRVL